MVAKGPRYGGQILGRGSGERWMFGEMGRLVKLLMQEVSERLVLERFFELR